MSDSNRSARGSVDAPLGSLESTSRPATLKDVARRAGVSIKTASRVLNDDPKVASTTRELVREVMTELGYRPDMAARSLRRGRDASVGVVVDSIGDPFFAELAASLEAAFAPHGLTVLVASSGRRPEREREVVSQMIQRRVSGLIVSPASADSLEWLGEPDMPVSFVDRVGNVPSSQSVVVDDRGNCAVAAEHLIRHGHRRIAILSDHPTVETTRQRIAGFRDAMASAGLHVDEDLVRADCQGTADAARVTGELLALDRPPTALISTNTRCSLGVIPVLHSANRRDIATVCYGDFAMAESLDPAVTVLDHSPTELGQVAARLLLERITGQTSVVEQDVVYVPVELIARGSGELPPWE